MKYVSLLLLAMFLVPLTASAHPGGTDAVGGHYCRTNCEQYGLQTNEYHYHDTDSNAVATYDHNAGVYDKVLADRLKGRILLQVQEHGEAWYIRSTDSKRYYMKDGATAYEMMRYFSLGITDNDLSGIPSVANTTEMNASSSICKTNALASRLSGNILLQVQQHGEAWYVDPVKCRSIYMADGAAAYEIMRYLGLGIVNGDLAKIVIGTTSFATPVATVPKTDEPKSTAPTALSFSGSGSDVTEIFQLQEGLALFTTTHSGQSNFITKLLDDQGNTVEYVANKIGDYSGVSSARIDKTGTYLLNVTADGSWTASISQPQATTGASVPFTVTGSSDAVSDPIKLTAGLHTFVMSHNGSANFIVQLVGTNGNTTEYLANEIGVVSLTQATGIDKTGIYYLSVVGDTSWSVTVN